MSELGRFIAVGLAATGLYLLLCNVVFFRFFPMFPDLGNLAAQGLSLLFSYQCHRAFTFRSTATHRRDASRFLVSTAIAVTICAGAFRGMLALGFSLFHATLFVSALYPALSFVLHFRWTFRAKREIDP